MKHSVYHRVRAIALDVGWTREGFDRFWDSRNRPGNAEAMFARATDRRIREVLGYLRECGVMAQDGTWIVEPTRRAR